MKSNIWDNQGTNLGLRTSKVKQVPPQWPGGCHGETGATSPAIKQQPIVGSFWLQQHWSIMTKMYI